MYSESDLLPLSALQHLVFCERQCALIHVERAWVENVFTAEGRVAHRRVHEEDGATEFRDGVRIARGVRLRSLLLGLTGVADVVEFHPLAADGKGIPLRNASGLWIPFPVEHKRGKPKQDHCDVVQLCAQAMCLEEMLECEIPCGALFYGQTRRRFDVDFDGTIRQETHSASSRLHQLFELECTPPAQYEKKCESCSLMSICLPETSGGKRSVTEYIRSSLHPMNRGSP